MPRSGGPSRSVSEQADPLPGLAHEAARAWFAETFPRGPTPAQLLAWPAVASGDHLLLVSPTGSGKTLAAFLAIIDKLIHDHTLGTLGPGLRCVYVSPLRSLGHDIERNLTGPLEGIRARGGFERSPISVAVRTGDTSAHHRRKLRDAPPHVLITTPESLALMLSQPAWRRHWAGVSHLIVDEVHALVPTKRGADLAVSLERLAAHAERDPARLGLSATCRPAEPVARFLVGRDRHCRILEAPPPGSSQDAELRVESLAFADEQSHRGPSYRRLLRRLASETRRNRTTLIFANTRAFTEKLTHDLRATLPEDLAASVAAHHSALDAQRRREVEGALKRGELRAVVSSTSLELGVDIGTVDLAVQVGLPGGVARLLQRVGRAGHGVGERSRGLILAATPAELAGAIVTARDARAGAIEPLRSVDAPLDVLCQQLVGMACEGDQARDAAYDLVTRAGPFANLARRDFDDCLAFLAGDLAAPAGAFEPEPGAAPRWTSPRLWSQRGHFGLRHGRVARWFRANVGTITSEESARVVAGGIDVGTLEEGYVDRLAPGDRFLLDGRAFEFRRLEGRIALARPTSGDPALPRWTSDRQSLTASLARSLASFRAEAARRLADGPQALRAWLGDAPPIGHDLDPDAAAVLVALFEAQERISEVPAPDGLLVEEYPHRDGLAYTFHAPLGRSACEALGRAIAARLGQRFGRDLGLTVADLGWSIQLADDAQLEPDDISSLLDPEGFADDVLEGLDRGELLARRFRHVATISLMVLRNPDGPRRRVGGTQWVATRLYPLVKAACPDHPLLRETRREVLEQLLDTPAALDFLMHRPAPRFRRLDMPSPFAAAWIEPGGIPSTPGPGHGESLRFESPENALKRLHARLFQAAASQLDEPVAS